MYVHGIDIAAARNRRGMKIGAKAVGILNGVRCGCVTVGVRRLHSEILLLLSDILQGNSRSGPDLSDNRQLGA